MSEYREDRKLIRGYIVTIGESWAVADSWRRANPSQPFVGIRVDPNGLWLAVEPRIGERPMPTAALSEVLHLLHQTGRDAWVDEQVILLELRTIREGHSLARRIVAILRRQNLSQPASVCDRELPEPTAED